VRSVNATVTARSQFCTVMAVETDLNTNNNAALRHHSHRPWPTCGEQDGGEKTRFCGSNLVYTCGQQPGPSTATGVYGDRRAALGTDIRVCSTLKALERELVHVGRCQTADRHGDLHRQASVPPMHTDCLLMRHTEQRLVFVTRRHSLWR